MSDCKKCDAGCKGCEQGTMTDKEFVELSAKLARVGLAAIAEAQAKLIAEKPEGFASENDKMQLTYNSSLQLLASLGLATRRVPEKMIDDVLRAYENMAQLMLKDMLGKQKDLADSAGIDLTPNVPAPKDPDKLN